MTPQPLSPQPLPTYPARRRLWLLAAAIAIGMSLFLFDNVEASTVFSTGSCSRIQIMVAGSSRIFSVWNNQFNSGVNACITSIPHFPVGANSGNAVSFHCLETTSGALPPGVPDANGIVISAYKDNDGFPDGATVIWTQTFTSCLTQQDFSKSCTSDGAVGSAKSFGIVRLYIRVIRTAVVAYDDSSDSGDDPNSGSIGAYLCNPRPTTAEAVSQPSTWVGGNTIINRWIVDATSYNSGNTGTLHTACANKETAHNGKTFGTDAVTDSNTIIGSEDTWQTGCAILLNATLDRKSAISGWTGTPYAHWATFSPISGVTFGSNVTATFTSAALNRNLLPNPACTINVDGVTATIANRGSTVGLQTCVWEDFIGNDVGAGIFQRCFYERSGLHGDTTDFLSGDLTFATLCSLIAKTTATDTFGGGLDYHAQAFAYNTSARTSAVLLNWGNSTDIFDVSATLIFENINISKTSPPTASNNNSCLPCTFIIGAELEFVKIRGLHEQSGVFIQNANVTCFRTLPSLSTETSFALSATDVNGDSGIASLQVFAPSGQWLLECNVSFNGNTGSYVIRFFHVSSFTGDRQYTINWNVTEEPNDDYHVNVSVLLRMYDAICDCALPLFPDGEVKLTVFAWNNSTRDFDNVFLNRSIMIPISTQRSSFFSEFNTNSTNLRPAFAIVFFNFTGAPAMAGEAFNLTNLTSNVFVIANTQVWDLQYGLPIMLSFMAIAGAIVAFGNKNPVPAFVAGVIQIIALYLTYTNSATLGSDNTAIFVVLFFLTFSLCMFRAASNMGRKEEV